MNTFKNKCTVLIDAENHGACVIPQIFRYISNNKLICEEAQAFGDFSTTAFSANYKINLVKYAVTAVQCFNLKKNSSDFGLVISTMDMLHQYPDVDTYIIASTDIDFLSLIIRLRKSNKTVIVFGSEHASEYIKQAASIFITTKKDLKSEPCQNTDKNLLIKTIQKAFNSNMKINLADLGNVLSQKLGSSYIYAKNGEKLSDFIISLGKYQVITDEKGTSVVYQT